MKPPMVGLRHVFYVNTVNIRRHWDGKLWRLNSTFKVFMNTTVSLVWKILELDFDIFGKMNVLKTVFIKCLKHFVLCNSAFETKHLKSLIQSFTGLDSPIWKLHNKDSTNIIAIKALFWWEKKCGGDNEYADYLKNAFKADMIATTDKRRDVCTVVWRDYKFYLQMLFFSTRICV